MTSSWNEGRNPFSMAPGYDHFRVRIVEEYFHNLIDERVWLWFKINRCLLRLLQFDRVDV